MTEGVPGQRSKASTAYPGFATGKRPSSWRRARGQRSTWPAWLTQCRKRTCRELSPSPAVDGIHRCLVAAALRVYAVRRRDDAIVVEEGDAHAAHRRAVLDSELELGAELEAAELQLSRAAHGGKLLRLAADDHVDVGARAVKREHLQPKRQGHRRLAADVGVERGPSES